MKGYYTKAEIADACRDISGLIGVVFRNHRWEHYYPPAIKARINPLTEDDFEYETTAFSDIHDGFEYVSLAGGRTKVIKIEDAVDYPMPKRWGATR